MSEDQDLLARIGKLSGHINHYKTQSPSMQSDTAYTFKQPQAWNKLTSGAPSSAAPWPTSRGASSSRGRGRVGKVAINPHRNRTLVLNKKAGTHAHGNEEIKPGSHQLDTSAIKSGVGDGNEPLQSANGWITKRDRHMQLINTSIFDKETQVRNKAIEETRKQKALRKDQREKQKIERHLKTLAPDTGYAIATRTVHEVNIDGLRFHVLDGGSKLARVRGEIFHGGSHLLLSSRLPGATDSASSTPKQANIGGVNFLRSKHGNLYRSGVVKAKRSAARFKKIPELCKRFTPTGTHFFTPPYADHPRSNTVTTPLVQPLYNTDGNPLCLGHCPKGPLCPYIHNKDRLAMCKEYLQTGSCPTGEFCDLSHDPTPERVPACLHFLRGKCSNASCRYTHVRVNPAASVCKDFAVLGYCGRGKECPERHAHECPDYANTGVCRKRKCHLPHVDRAGQMRKHAANVTDPTVGSADDDDSDLVSDDDDTDSDDVDSDDLKDDPRQHPDADDTASQASHALSQQQDYVQF